MDYAALLTEKAGRGGRRAFGGDSGPPATWAGQTTWQRPHLVQALSISSTRPDSASRSTAFLASLTLPWRSCFCVSFGQVQFRLRKT